MPTRSRRDMARSSASALGRCRTRCGARVMLPRTEMWGKRLNCWKDHADFASDGVEVSEVVGHLDAVDDDLALLVLFESVDHTYECGLAGAGGTEDDDNFSPLDGHCDVVYGAEVSEPLEDVFADDDVVAFHKWDVADVGIGDGDGLFGYGGHGLVCPWLFHPHPSPLPSRERGYSWRRFCSLSHQR